MVDDWFETQTNLVVNRKRNLNHAAYLLELIKTSNSFDCMSAFASELGLELIHDALLDRLKDGRSARFILGIDFFQTAPVVLYDLLELAEEYPGFALYMGNASAKAVFHPKVYAFEDCDGDCCIVLGSANLTRGGLENNHEMSALIRAEGADLFKSISAEIGQLIRTGEVVEATADLIDAYAVQHGEYTFHQSIARKRARLAKPSADQSMDKLKAILAVMKLEPGEQNPRISVFEEQSRLRAVDRMKARDTLERIAAAPTLNKTQFLKLYDSLVVEHLWHSGGLQRHRAKVATRAKLFQQALRMIEQVVKVTPDKFIPEVVFGPLLDKFKDIPQAGINILTEVLHSYDPNSFAIMNQNSVSGLGLANITGFPLRPTKTTVSPEKYVRFCSKCREICEALDLKSFSELDALLNYAYWN